MDKFSKYVTIIVLILVGGILVFDKVTAIKARTQEDQIKILKEINEKMDKVLQKNNIKPDNRGAFPPIGAAPS